ncbi:MAG: Flp pilus assembly complex ATPase component TadA, partial [Desulfovibrio sp.]|uniref:ATPase, T2SS/T4P/T4SS family n=1 Tax=Desulfovibrio sp. TaxID=885 RepID=UPI0025BA4BAE
RLLMLSLRMRPDRICVGEVRNAYALDLMDCWNTGHDGGVATIHATNAERGLSRLASLISRNPFRPAVIEEVIGESVQRIVFIKKTPEGRRIQTILSVDGYAKTRKEYEIKRLA